MTDPLQPAGDQPPRDDPGPATPSVLPLASVIAKPAPSGRGTSLLLLLAGAVAVGGLAFAGGRLTAPAARPRPGRQGTGQRPRRPAPRQRPGLRRSR